MKSFNSVLPLSDPKGRTCLCSLFIIASLICGGYFLGSAISAKDYRMPPGFILNGSQQNPQSSCKVLPQVVVEVNETTERSQSNKCKEKCMPPGSGALPEGIISKTSNLEMRPLWGPIAEKKKSKRPVNLLAVAAGIKQKKLVNQIVEKFLANNFVVMLFHYDGVVDEWNDLGWTDKVIHISAMNQTKWWFAKRFLHPDIVSEYEYIFLWDEDLGVENFDPGRYLSIVEEEGLEVSQPALDPAKSEIHHQITVRRRRSRVHRRFYKNKGGGKCNSSSIAPPCAGWVEVMAPVFSNAAWRCTWYMIQNDLIHAWGLDMQLGYCAQGDRAIKVGVVDAEYVTHLGLPTLGGNSHGQKQLNEDLPEHLPHVMNLTDSNPSTTQLLNKFDNRSAVRKQSYIEMMTFRRRWNKAVEEDECWVDPYNNNSENRRH